MQTTTVNDMNDPNSDAPTSPPPHPPLSSMATPSLANSTRKTWSSSRSQSTHMDASVRCSKPSSPRQTTHPRSLGAHPPTTANATVLTRTSCTLEPPLLLAPSAFLHRPTLIGRHLLHPPAEPSSAIGNSYTAPTPSLHTIQLLGLGISKAFSSLLCSATRTFSLPPTAPTFDLYSFLTLEDTYPVRT